MIKIETKEELVNWLNTLHQSEEQKLNKLKSEEPWTNEDENLGRVDMLDEILNLLDKESHGKNRN